jgi:hypothetical protein
MGLTETFIFYLLIGASVAVAEFLGDSSGGPARKLFRTSTGLLFWPLYLPLILSRSTCETVSVVRTQRGAADDMERAITQVDAELDAAMSSLDGWAEDVLAREIDRIHELRHAWDAQAARIREMDRLLVEPETQVDPHKSQGSRMSSESDRSTDRWRHSEMARQKNMQRLHQVRRQAYDDLMGTLAWVRELVSMIHLAKFTGAPRSRAEELVAQVAAAVEGVSAVTWQEMEEVKG